MKAFALALTFISIFFIGYGVAHSEISTECQKLNAFYVGNVVYECRVK
ncbi:hypothetical protein [Gilliamella sp. BG6]|nr:hypothetical protein [Gilliamella sp.]